MAVSQINRALIRPVTIAAAVIGAIQALAWTSLSLVSILYYHSVILIDDTLPKNSFAIVTYNLFLDSDYTDDTIIVTPRVFDIFMIVFMISNFLWLFMSLYILWATTRDRWKEGFTMVGGWSTITLGIAILDIILLGIIAADFNTVLHASDQTDITSTTEPVVTVPTTIPTSSLTTITIASTTPALFDTTEAYTTDDESILDIGKFRVDLNELSLDELEATKQIIYMSYGVIMSLAARGYVLLILNITFAIILIKFASVMKNDRATSLLPIIGAYATGGRPWNNLYEQTDISNGYANGAFADENNQSAFPRSDSFIANDAQIRNNNPLSSRANPYGQNFERNIPRQPSPQNPNIVESRLARIGKKGGNRTPPLNVPPPVIPNMPYIPDPDYSPPVSPRSKPKSVLRPKSNYVL